MMAQQDITRQESHSDRAKWPLKVISAGHIRCGTCSLAEALDQLGFGPVFHFVRNWQTAEGAGVNDKALDWLFTHLDSVDRGEDADWSEFCELVGCHSILDSPIYNYWERMFKQNPSAKVIVSVRDFDGWYDNVVKVYHTVMVKPWWYPLVMYLNNLHLVLWYGHNPNNKLQYVVAERTVKDYGGWEQFICDKQFVREKFFARIEYIKSVVPKSQLLIFSVKEGWEPLAKFLGVPPDKIPKQPFPRMNGSKNLVSDIQKTWYEQLDIFIWWRCLPLTMVFALCFVYCLRLVL